MSDKKFSSFYKLNDEEINKLKEEVSGDNVRNSVPVNSILKWTEYSAPKKVDLSSLSWTEYSAPERIDSPAPKRTEYSASQGVDSPTPKRTKYSAPKAKKKFATKEDIVFVVIFGIMTSISAFGTIKDFKNKSIVSEPDTKTEITTENIISETQPATEEIKQSDDEFYGNLLGNSEKWECGVTAEDRSDFATFEYTGDSLIISAENANSLEYDFAYGRYTNLNLSKDCVYHIEFDYKSSDNFDAYNASLTVRSYNPFIIYYNDRIDFSTENQHYSAYFIMPVNNDDVCLDFQYNNCKDMDYYSITFENISLSRCKLSDDFDYDAGDGAGYYDKDNNYHKYED